MDIYIYIYYMLICLDMNMYPCLYVSNLHWNLSYLFKHLFHICVHVYVSISICIHVCRGACACACTEARKNIKLLKDIWTPVLLHGSQNLKRVLVSLQQELLTVESFSFNILFWWQLGGKWYFKNNISFKIRKRIC